MVPMLRTKFFTRCWVVCTPSCCSEASSWKLTHTTFNCSADFPCCLTAPIKNEDRLASWYVTLMLGPSLSKFHLNHIIVKFQTLINIWVKGSWLEKLTDFSMKYFYIVPWILYLCFISTSENVNHPSAIRLAVGLSLSSLDSKYSSLKSNRWKSL